MLRDSIASLASASALLTSTDVRTEAQGDTWESISKLPAFSGLWEMTAGGGPRAFGEAPSLMPAYAEQLADYRQVQARDEIGHIPTGNWVASGMPAIMAQPYPIEILFTPGKVTILIEAYSQWRQIFTDGRPHPVAPEPTANGHSIGHWQDETLIVDTVGFSTHTFLGTPGMRHSAKMRIVERFRLISLERLEIETTITDPEALTKPWKSTRAYDRYLDWTLTEHVVTQNNRNGVTDDGKALRDVVSVLGALESSE